VAIGLKIKKPAKGTKRNARKALSLLRFKNSFLYQAAYPNYPSNFSRDSLIYTMLSADKKGMREQIAFSAENQGKKADPVTGEEPGKIHHELPAAVMNGKSSAYNACDTTAIFLLAIASLNESGDENILDIYADNIEAGIAYIKSHVRDGLFYEDPGYSGSTNFALKVTYWKDSEINHENSSTKYPIVYSLAHFQNSAALRAIGIALYRSDLIDLAKKMTDTGIDRLWQDDHFIVARDGEGKDIDPVSSDSLHSLNYINPAYISADYVGKIEKYMEKLETKAGYLSGVACRDEIDEYHTRYVWTHEQALLHSASKKHSMSKSASVSSRAVEYMDTFPEIIDPIDGFKPAGNQPQLWAIGASRYFEKTLYTPSERYARAISRITTQHSFLHLVNSDTVRLNYLSKFYRKNSPKKKSQ
jgi:hypothetical protein